MERIIHELHRIGAIKFGQFTLKSGMLSPIYIDLRLIISYPELLKDITHKLEEKAASLTFERVCGVPYTALPLATALSLTMGIPMVMRRKEAKNYGTKKIIEGAFEPGQKCLVIEDLITSGTSIFETLEPLEEEGLKITDILVLLDRQQGGRRRVEESGYRLHALFTMEDLLSMLEEKIGEEQVAQVQNFLKNNIC